MKPLQANRIPPNASRPPGAAGMWTTRGSDTLKGMVLRVVNQPGMRLFPAFIGMNVIRDLLAVQDSPGQTAWGLLLGTRQGVDGAVFLVVDTVKPAMHTPPLARMTEGNWSALMALADREHPGKAVLGWYRAVTGNDGLDGERANPGAGVGRFGLLVDPRRGATALLAQGDDGLEPCGFRIYGEPGEVRGPNDFVPLPLVGPTAPETAAPPIGKNGNGITGVPDVGALVRTIMAHATGKRPVETGNGAHEGDIRFVVGMAFIVVVLSVMIVLVFKA